jgi:hypothetical protein
VSHTHQPVSVERLQARCDHFNEIYKPGDVILVRKVMGEPETLVRTISNYGAQVLGGHSAVVYVTDGGACWDLDFVVGLRNAEAMS